MSASKKRRRKKYRDFSVSFHWFIGYKVADDPSAYREDERREFLGKVKTFFGYLCIPATIIYGAIDDLIWQISEWRENRKQ